MTLIEDRATTGADAVAWAAGAMPLLAAAAAEVGPGLAGHRLGACLHVEPKTAVLCLALVAAGVEVTITGSPGTTDDDVAEHLRSHGVAVVGGRGDDEQVHARNVDQVLAGGPDLILDNGGDLTAAVLREGNEGLRDGVLGGTEETTSGGLRLRALPRPPSFPVVVINDSPLKQLVENEFGVGHSIVQGFQNATNLMVAAAPATVVGYGPCGRGVAGTLARLGAHVTVVDTDPYRALEAALRGHRVSALAHALPETRLLFLATGRSGVLPRSLVDLLPDGAVIAGVSHFPVELDLADLAAGSDQVTRTHPSGHDHTTYTRADGRRVTVLHGGRMINLAAAGGNPIEAMDLGLTLQIRSLAAVAAGGLAAGVQPVPADLDTRVATDVVARWTAPPGRQP